MRRSTQNDAMHPPGSPTISAIPARGATRAWLAVIIGLSGVVGGYQLQRILNALPDSNDDFIFF